MQLSLQKPTVLQKLRIIPKTSQHFFVFFLIYCKHFLFLFECVFKKFVPRLQTCDFCNHVLQPFHARTVLSSLSTFTFSHMKLYTPSPHPEGGGASLLFNFLMCIRCNKVLGSGSAANIIHFNTNLSLLLLYVQCYFTHTHTYIHTKTHTNKRQRINAFFSYIC